MVLQLVQQHKRFGRLDGVGDGSGTDVGRAVSLDIAVSGGIPSMNLGYGY